MPDAKRGTFTVDLGRPSVPAASFKPSDGEVPADLSTEGLAESSSAESDAGKDTTTPCRVRARPTRVLMVATLFKMPYRVMRCAQVSPAEVYVLGNPGARGLRFSRYCRRFFLSECIIHGGCDEALALEINCLVRELGITMVMPGDAPSTRALIACRELIEAPCFPLPSLNHFDFLNNKWAFAQLCEDLGVRCPVTRLLPDVATLAQEITTGRLGCPLVAKPLSRSGSGGVVVLDGIDLESRLRMINYRPIVVQEWIAGVDIGTSVYAKAGNIKAFVAHRYHRGVYSTFKHDQIYSDVAKIVSNYGLDGVYNFDMILAPNGSIYYLECNPRFFFKINLSMIAGINFVELGLAGEKSTSSRSINDGLQVRPPLAVLASPSTWGRVTKHDLAMAAYICSDPLPYWMECLGLTV
jgi:predicted ATP-grasp superfamily ATP-dependent carboligase